MLVLASSPSHPSIYRSCKSLAEFPVADRNTLSGGDRDLVVSLEREARDKRGAGEKSAGIHQLTDRIFLTIDPGLAKGEEFGTRELTLVWRLDGVTNSITHAIRSERIYFWSTINDAATTASYTFFGGDTHLEVIFNAPGSLNAAKLESVSVRIVTGMPDLEKTVCAK